MKHHFPVLSDCNYLDTASSGILTQSLYEWRRAHDREFLLKGSAFRIYQQDFLDGVRTTVGRFFRAANESTFLVPNFSYGFNNVLNLLSPGHSILLLKDDYPSLLNPPKAAGISVIEVEVDRDIHSRLYTAIRTYKPTIFAFSMVQYISGFKLGAAFVRTLKKDFPELLLLADGTQWCGTELIDFQQSGLDMLGASGYKWMLAGYGNGFMLLSDQLRSVLETEDLRIAMEPGHLDTLNFGSLQESIRYLESAGMANVQSKVTAISRAAHGALASMGLLQGIAVETEYHSQLFNLKISRSIHHRLRSENIVCIERGEGTRVGFHFYNNEDDLRHLLDVLKV